jgi:predicted outer membrane repeat protein
LALSTYTVNSLADINPPTGVTTLRQAILAANADTGSSPQHPDIIDFSVSGTISLNAALPAVTGNVSIQGPGASSLTIQGDHLGDAILTLGTGSSAVVSGVTLDGKGTMLMPGSNSGISVGLGATLSVENGVIEDCVANGNGGAIDNEAGKGTVSVTDVQFLDNFAGVLGGAIANIGGSLTVTQSTFNGDFANGSGGGGIYASSSSAGAPAQLTVLDSTFSNDGGAPSGGGIEVSRGVAAVIADCTFTDDSAENGGAIGVARVTNSAILPTTLELSGSTISGNSPIGGGVGGALYVEPDAGDFTATVMVRDTIIAGNTGGDVVGAIDPSSAFNLIGNGTGLTGISNGVNGNLIGTSTAPINPLLGPLQNNGGPTETMALLPGSPAIDHGGSDPVADALMSTDQRGDPRIVVQPLMLEPAGGDGRDIGAYELAAQTTPTVLTVDSLADANPPAGVLTLRQALEAATGSIPLSSLPASQVSAGSPYFFEIQISVTGTIALDSQLPAIANAGVSIQGPGASSLTIQGDHLGDAMLTLGTGSSAVVSGVTLDGAGTMLVPVSDSGITVGLGATLSVENSVIEYCVANGNGGAIDNEAGGGTVSVSDVQFLDDLADGQGGAIANIGGSLTVTQSTFDDNFATSGGGIYSAASPVGGEAELTALNSTFSNEEAVNNGGGIDLSRGVTASITDCTFSANTVGDKGGAICVSVFGTPTPTGLPVTLDLSGSTIFGNNELNAGGGGLYVEPDAGDFTATVVVRDTIVAGNTGGDVSGPVDPSGAFNLIGNGTGLTGISNGVNGNLIGTSTAPINPLLGPLQNNGGPTETMALLPGSPALDAGSGEATSDTDQRGVARGHVIDIGAYQATASQLVVETQSPAGVDVAQSVTVLALDAFGQVAYDNQDAISFTSSDPAAILPGPSPLTQGSVNVQITFKTAGEQSLTATDGQGGFSGTQTNILVNSATTTTSVLASLNPSTYGQAVTFTATVTTGSAFGTPVGIVTFLDGNITLGTATLSGGSASFTTSALAAGTHAITVSYSANGGFSGSTSAVLTETVSQAGTNTNLTVSPTVTAPGRPVTLQAFVAVVTPGGGNPPGTVTFYDGSSALGTAPLGAGVASFTATSLSAGVHHFMAVDSSTANYAGSTSAVVSVLVVPSPVVHSVVINGGAVQRSMVTDLTVTFNEQVTLSSGAVVVDKRGGGAEGLVLSESVVNGESVVNVTFIGSDIIGGSLLDGSYTLVVNAVDVHDQAGEAMAANANDSFWRLFGDARGTGLVNALDYQMLLQSEKSQTNLSIFDYYGTGVLNSADLTEFLLRFATSI